MAFRKEHPLLSVSGLFFLSVVFVGLFMHFVGYDQVDDHNLSRRYLPVSWDYPLGTDGYGRNVLMLLLKGVQAFFIPGVVAALIASILGAALGGLSGTLEGRAKRVLLASLRLLDALPRLVMLILLCSIMEPSMMLIAASVGVLFVPAIARTIQYRVEALAAGACV